jgi:DNA-binding response OmpR family regulator
VISGHAWTAEHRQRALDAGFVDHLGKPFHYQKLIDRVEAHTRAGRQS